MKDILIIAQYILTPSEGGNGRFTYIADLLSRENNVEIVTTKFSHSKKQHRNVGENDSIEQCKITMLYEPGYSKNVCLERFYSHFILSKNLKKYLEKRKKPDVIYCAIPSLDIANVASKYAKRNNIRFIIDIQDIWPEAFKMVFNVPIISSIVFKPMEMMANNIYKRADEIIAVSQTYVNRALKVNKKINKGLSVFLGTELEYFDRLAKQNKIIKPENEVWLIYVGTLGHSYDLELVIEALSELKKQGIENLRFMVLGDGPLKQKFKEQAQMLDINTEFTGRLDYGKMVGYLVASDIAVNPISKGAAQSIINKVGDYAAGGIPVINTQECEEYRGLIDGYRCGINCNNGNREELVDAILQLYNNVEARMIMGKNNRKLGIEKFDRKITYQNIIKIIRGEEDEY